MSKCERSMIFTIAMRIDRKSSVLLQIDVAFALYVDKTQIKVPDD